MPPPTDLRGTGSGFSSALPERTLGSAKIPYEILKYIPEESAEHYRFAPLAVVEGVLEIGIVDPDNIAAIDALNFITRKTGMPFKLFKIPDSDIEKVIQMYRGLGGDVDRALSDLQSEEQVRKKDDAPKEFSDEEDLLQLGNLAGQGGGNDTIREDAPAVKIVSTILRYAIDGKASDIHIEPTGAGVRVRYRVDGELHTSVVLPMETHRAIIARVKVLSSIRLDERRKPQDGRFSASFDDRQIDFRVSTFPTYMGEKIVMRILDRNQGFIPLGDLGFSERDLGLIREAIKRPHGLILISGPTGSGKSTTLYSMLAELDREHQNVLSLEDPIEYHVEGIIQSQVRPEIGYTFANGLRTTLRQDPDIIMVGEIRDGETAKLAMQAALTGHLVLSTIHTNDAVGTIPRLIDMGVEPYLIPSTLILSMAQRLVRTLCDGTGKPVPLSASDRTAIEKDLSTIPAKYRFPIPNEVYEPERSAACPTGMRGRAAVFEVLEMSSEIEKIVLTNPVDSKLWAAARSQGMRTMREDAILKAFAKRVPFSEVNTLSPLLLGDEADQVAVTEIPAGEASSEEKSIPDETTTQ